MAQTQEQVGDSVAQLDGGESEIRFPLGMPQRDQQLTSYPKPFDVACSPSRLVRTGATIVHQQIEDS